jgi:hypothetical protein
VQKKKPEPAPISAPPPALESVPTEPAIDLSNIDVGDDLPSVGKVWEGERVSLGAAFKRAAGKPAPLPAPARSAEPLSNVEPVSDDLRQLWQRWLNALHQQGPSLPPLLEGARLEGIEEGRAILKFSHEDAPRARLLERNGKKEALVQALSEAHGQPLGLKIEIEPKSDAPQPARPAATLAPMPRRPAPPSRPPASESESPPPAPLTPELIEQVQADPLVRAVMRELGAMPLRIE